MDDLIRDFVVETLENLDLLDADLLRFEREPGDARFVSQIYRLLHTIKGTCGFLALNRLERVSHAAEELVSRFRSDGAGSREDVSLILVALDRIKAIVVTLAETGREPAGADSELIGLLRRAAERAPLMRDVAEPDDDPGQAGTATEPEVMRQNVRVPVDRLDHLMNMVSELVLVRNQLLDLSRHEDAGGYKVPLQRLSQITAELQDGVMRTRMQSIGAAWAKIARTVRDLASELGKEIRIETCGAETEIDRQILAVIKDCVIHLIRNAADHGIESPSERLALGKPATGTIRIRAGQEGSHIVMEVSDDGRGLDLDRLRAKAAATGLMDDDAFLRLSDQEVARLIFAAGVSTAGAVTNMSGRGVGLDAVRSSIEAIGGMVDVTSRPGQGTSIILRMPLTLAVAGVLIIEAAGQIYALPQVVIAELVRPQATGDIRLDMLGDAPVLRMRDSLVPVIDLAGALCVRGADRATGGTGGFVVICDVGKKRFGLRVDAVHQTEDVVVKPVPVRLRHISYYSGTTIMGDGSVILILEPTGFAAHVQNARDVAPRADAESADTGHGALTPLLVFRAGDSRKRAVPLALVSRLEELDASRIEHLGAQPVIQYAGALLPLLPADPAMTLRRDGLQPVLKFRHNGRRIGVAVDEIVDVIEARLTVDLRDDLVGYIGCAIIDGETMPILDVAGLFGDHAALPRPDDGGNRLLLVERSAFFHALLMPLLTGAGFAVTWAKTHAEARTLVHQTAFAVSIVDVDHPDGLVLAGEWIAAQPPVGGIVHALVTRPGPHMAALARQAGVGSLIGKFDRRTLLATLGAGLPAQEVAA